MSATAQLDISIIAACRNESKHILAFLESLSRQDLAGVEWEAIIADGKSDDGTRDLLKTFCAANPRVRFIDRKDQITEFEVGFGSNLFKAGLARSLPFFNGPMKVLHCWGKGLCGACFVDVVRGADRLPERTAVERRKLRGFPDAVRLACQVRLTSDVTIRKPRGILRPRRERTRSARAADALLSTGSMRASGADGVDASTDVTATRGAVSHPS